MTGKLPWDQLLVLGCAQSCAVALPAVIANISRLRRLFVASQVLILENDSSDAPAGSVARLGPAVGARLR
jgi:hypothetical protein